MRGSTAAAEGVGRSRCHYPAEGVGGGQEEQSHVERGGDRAGGEVHDEPNDIRPAVQAGVWNHRGGARRANSDARDDLQPPTGPVLASRALIDVAMDLGWRLKWQRKNPKRAGSASRTRFGGSCGATNYEEAQLGVIPF